MDGIKRIYKRLNYTILNILEEMIVPGSINIIYNVERCGFDNQLKCGTINLFEGFEDIWNDLSV